MPIPAGALGVMRQRAHWQCLHVTRHGSVSTLSTAWNCVWFVPDNLSEANARSPPWKGPAVQRTVKTPISNETW